ncbi:MAG: histidine phosphatase family protein [Janthinobacterium lividum]
MMLTLTIVRHGDTFAPGEPPRRIGARTDLSLVASGEAQARLLGRAFAGEGVVFDRVLVAPLRRTRETADLLTAMLPAAPAIEPAEWLAEIDHGPDEGQGEDAVLARIGPTALARWNDALVPPPGWLVDAPARLAGWRALMAKDGGHVLLVTSNGAARFALQADARLADQARMLPSGRLRTGAWGRTVRDEGDWQIAAWDRRP